eukprot:5458731-Pyramimonas_sp.AAC.1
MEIRRLRMYQTWAFDPPHHCQVLCSLFGGAQFDQDRPPLDRILDDIVGDLAMLGDRERAADLLLIDFQEIRARQFSVQ